MTRTPTPSQARKVCLSSRIESVVRKTNTRSFQGSLALIQRRSHRIGAKGSADPPLADFGRHCQLVALVQKEQAAWVGQSALFSLASLMLTGFFSHVRPAVCRQVAYAKLQRSGVNKDGQQDVQ